MSDAAIERLSRKREQRGGNRAAVEELQVRSSSLAAPILAAPRHLRTCITRLILKPRQAEVEALREQLQFAEDQSKQLLEERDDAQDGLLEAQVRTSESDVAPALF